MYRQKIILTDSATKENLWVRVAGKKSKQKKQKNSKQVKKRILFKTDNEPVKAP